MKKLFFLFLTIIVCFSFSHSSYAVMLTPKAKSACLMELETAQVLYEKDSNLMLPPASMTKIMTMLIVLDEIKAKRASWNDIVTASKNAVMMGGSQIFLKESEQMTLKDMFKSVAIASANDCAFALGEHLFGTNEEMVRKMNEYCNSLGLKNTSFKNVTGLPVEGHYSSSYDMALLSRYLLLNHEAEIIPFTSTYMDYVREDTTSPFWLVNTNKVLKQDSAIDGLKTGWTEDAGYCITLTKRDDGMRLIGVVMGYPTSAERNEECYNMLSYGFNSFKLNKIVDCNDCIDSFDNYLYKGIIEVKPARNIYFVDKKGIEINKSIVYEYGIKDDYLTGRIIVNVNGRQIETNIEEKELIRRNIFELFFYLLERINM